MHSFNHLLYLYKEIQLTNFCIRFTNLLTFEFIQYTLENVGFYMVKHT